MPQQAPQAAPQQQPTIDPAQLQLFLQQLQQSGQLPGYTLTKDPEPVQPLQPRDFLQALVHRFPWHTEEVQRAMHAAAHALADVLDSIQTDVAQIRARLGVYAQPVTPQQAAVLQAQGQPVPANIAPAPQQAPQAPALQLPQVPAQFAPQPQQPQTPLPQFGPTGVPIAPPAPAPAPTAPTAPQFAMFAPTGVPMAPPAPGGPGVPAGA